VKPKLKGSVYFMPTNDGLYLAGLSGRHLIRGKGVYPLFNVLSQMMDGTRSMQDILDETPASRISIVQKIVNLMDEWEYIVDASECDASLDGHMREVYASTLRYLADMSSTPNKDFLEYHETVVCLAGSSSLASQSIRAMMHLGTRTVVVMNNDTQDIDLVNDTVAEFNDRWRGDFTVRRELEEAPHLLVFFGGLDLSSEWEVYREKVDELQIPLLPVLVRGDSVFIGPWCGAGSEYCIDCLMLQHEQATKPASQLTPVMQRVVGNLISLEILRKSTEIGGKEPSCSNHVIQVSDDLTTDYHSIQPLYSCPQHHRIIKDIDPHSSVNPIITEPDDVTLQNLNSLINPVFGLVYKAEEGDLDQTIFAQCGFSIAGGQDFVVAASNNVAARFYGITIGIAMYYRNLRSQEIQKDTLTLCCRSPQEALIRAAMTEVETMNEAIEKWSDGSPDTEQSRYLSQMIKTHTGHQPTVEYAQSYYGLYVARVSLSSSKVCAVHPRLDKAMEDALARTLYFQLFDRESEENMVHFSVVIPSPVEREDLWSVFSKLDEAATENKNKLICVEVPIPSLIKEQGLHLFNVKARGYVGGRNYGE